jgi:hypothetical protein
VKRAPERSIERTLGCQATPCSDVVVEPVKKVEDDGVARHPLRDFTGTVAVLEDVARETRRLVVELDEPMEFDAGQYAEISVPGTKVARQYSMASPPSQTRRLEFHIRRTPGGIATDGWVFASLTEGDRVELKGPLGEFGLNVAQHEPAILIGGGTGLAPLKSIVQHALAVDLAPRLYLYHGGRGGRSLRRGVLPRAGAAPRPLQLPAVPLGAAGPGRPGRSRTSCSPTSAPARAQRLPLRAPGDGRSRGEGDEAAPDGAPPDLPGGVTRRLERAAAVS